VGECWPDGYAISCKLPLGETTLDVYLNDHVCWRNIPVKIWDHTISGYSVIKKWLSYREKELLGRSLTVEEAR